MLIRKEYHALLVMLPARFCLRKPYGARVDQIRPSCIPADMSMARQTRMSSFLRAPRAQDPCPCQTKLPDRTVLIHLGCFPPFTFTHRRYPHILSYVGLMSSPSVGVVRRVACRLERSSSTPWLICGDIN